MPRADRHSSDNVWVIVLRYLGIEREILVLKVSGLDYFAFTPRDRLPISASHLHITYHKSGERHMVTKSRRGGKLCEDECPPLPWEKGKQPQTMRKKSSVQLQPPSELRGSELLIQIGIFRGEFEKAYPVGTNAGEQVTLDGDTVGFADEYTVVRAFLVEPGREDSVPTEGGPRIVKVIKQPVPWLAVCAFQLALSANAAS